MQVDGRVDHIHAGADEFVKEMTKS
jgi:hypothetical protein